MLKKTISFKDLDGNDVVDTFYFGLSKADVVELEASQKGGLSEYAKKIVATEDMKSLIKIFKELIAMSVGVRGEDGRQFVKTDAVRDAFMQTDAYSELFVELASNSASAIEFFNGIVPADLTDKMKEAMASTGVTEETTSTTTTTTVSTQKKTPAELIQEKLDADPTWIPSDSDIRQMTASQLQEAFRRKQAS